MQHNGLVNDTVNRFKKEKMLLENIADAITAVNPGTPNFFLSPKLQKPDNPGHPGISSVEVLYSEHLRYVDYHLQTIVKEMPSYVTDTNAFSNKTKVKSLY